MSCIEHLHATNLPIQKFCNILETKLAAVLVDYIYLNLCVNLRSNYKYNNKKAEKNVKYLKRCN